MRARLDMLTLVTQPASVPTLFVELARADGAAKPHMGEIRAEAARSPWVPRTTWHEPHPPARNSSRPRRETDRRPGRLRLSAAPGVEGGLQRQNIERHAGMLIAAELGADAAVPGRPP